MKTIRIILSGIFIVLLTSEFPAQERSGKRSTAKAELGETFSKEKYNNYSRNRDAFVKTAVQIGWGRNYDRSGPVTQETMYVCGKMNMR